MSISKTTIAAIATPPGRGGVGIVRVSGPLVPQMIKSLIGYLPKPRTAVYSDFKNATHKTIDQGICLYFPRPNSFTGEDVLELQGHGGAYVLDDILKTVTELGASIALPGEFSKRAFLNNKIDLVQAEAIADLINAGSKQAATSALRSLQGEFSLHINQLCTKLIELRMFVEAAIDFPEEDIDFITNSTVIDDLNQLIQKIKLLKQSALQGVLLQEGMTLVLIGKPNVGKSSLLNCLSGRESAIVTPIPGTTRDVLREYIHIDGLPLHIVDTAGLRESDDIIEQEGMNRARQAILQADLVLLMLDAFENDTASSIESVIEELKVHIPTTIPLLLIRNKIDLLQELPKQKKLLGHDMIQLSVKKHQGIELLIQYLKQKMGYAHSLEGVFMARRRHLTAIEFTYQHLIAGKKQWEENFASELLAEELTAAQRALNEITGEFTSDDLLGKIFSSFCIGK